ncbi:autophagy protein, putative, partial [Entamoeba invadens IP1]|uniref:autophagy protein, putative n=1 Tax=Entamoeba invadens IP1 TaxID=370355 RepID=UPI0002C3D720
YIAFKDATRKEIFNTFSEKCAVEYNKDRSKYDFHFIGGCPVPKQHLVEATYVDITDEDAKNIQEKMKSSIALNSHFEALTTDDTEAYILDLSSMKHTPGWTARTLIHQQFTTIHCIRPTHSFTIKVVHKELPLDGMSGWFTVKSTGKIVPQVHHLAESMNPEMLATQAVELNLQLMKWQLFKSLDLEMLKQTKCLLIGAGTLGCNVSRVLMGWGVQYITFVDNGTISYSNPVRQSLYNFNDCVQKRYKSERAAESLKEVFPGMQSRGVVMSIPMPGHPIGEKEIEGTRKDIQSLDKLVQENDVVFLLGDSRECRWLPSMLSSVYNKLCITVGLGFDSFVVMRHGDQEIEEKRPSCYFCADIVAPTDSLSRRTLDQQCTVTRPGISYVAAAMAVEMMVGILHHPLKNKAPSSGNGHIPHQLRGFLNTWNIEEGVGCAYSKCIACSKKIVEEYKQRGSDMVLEAINCPKSLEVIAGIPEVGDKEIEILTDSEDI